ncbi:MAG: glycosyltransferase family 2 protein [Promethearchaeota archaeon]
MNFFISAHPDRISEEDLFMTSDLPHISIIIINWNGWKDTIECLESLYQMSYPNFDIFLLDNNSSDNSINEIKSYCLGKLKIRSKYLKYNSNNKPINIFEYHYQNIEFHQNLNQITNSLKQKSENKLHLIINEKNYMFVEGNNIGIRYAIKYINTDYILLLNNDTIVEKDLIEEIVKIIDNNKKIGIIGPRICSYDNPNQNQWESLQNLNNYLYEIDFVSGAALLLRKELIQKIGFLDNRYIQYVEDKDYCYSARRAGYKVIYAQTKSKILHKVSVSMKKITGFQLYFKTRNTFLFKCKHSKKSQFLLFIFRFFLITFLMELKRYPDEKRHFLKGVKDGILLILK